jgi:hypothetical protein
VSYYRPLHDNWAVRPIAGPEIPAGIGMEPIPATVPGCVHTDLLTAGLIPDPYLDDNERHLTWIGRTDWAYETTFEWDGTGERTDLVCATPHCDLGEGHLWVHNRCGTALAAGVSAVAGSCQDHGVGDDVRRHGEQVTGVVGRCRLPVAAHDGQHASGCQHPVIATTTRSKSARSTSM